MDHFEYKVVHSEIGTNSFFNGNKTNETINSIERTTNQLGSEGWELVNVLHLTNGSPAQVSGALHYFKRKKEAQ